MSSATSPRAPKRGVLLLNLGSPDSTSTRDVRRYLREFLSDPRVLDAPAPVRAAVLNLFILPFRPKKSAEAYASIWRPEGSPLILITQQVAAALRQVIDLPVAVGMRYGNPSTEVGIRALLDQGVNDILAIPLYPHYAMSSYETAAAHALSEAERIAPHVKMTIQPPFYAAPDYLDAITEITREHLPEGFDHLLFSYHGVPERHIRKGDPSGVYCLNYEGCCDREHPAHSMCYRHQAYETTRQVAARLGLEPEQFSVAFQSRLGRDPWLKPYTDKTLEELPTRGVKDVVVICPAFVSDCLETLEEINEEARHSFLRAGGKRFTYIPCLNDHPRWIAVLRRFVRDFEAAREVIDAPDAAAE